MCPTKNQCPEIIEQLFQFRKHGNFVGNNVVIIGDMGEAVWWNRPQLEDTTAAWGTHLGMPCCNLPISFGKAQTWKSQYNILLNKNNIPSAVALKFNHNLTVEELTKLKHMSFAVLLNTLKQIGVQDSDLCVINNDLLLRGKKFAGSEEVYTDTIYTECIYITLKYFDEKELFDQLSCGKVSATAHREITGLIDEYPEITKEKFLTVYCEEFKKYLDQFEL
jgi:hypothetical protein